MRHTGAGWEMFVPNEGNTEVRGEMVGPSEVITHEQQSTAGQLIHNPLVQFVTQALLYSQLQLRL